MSPVADVQVEQSHPGPLGRVRRLPVLRAFGVRVPLVARIALASALLAVLVEDDLGDVHLTSLARGTPPRRPFRSGATAQAVWARPRAMTPARRRATSAGSKPALHAAEVAASIPGPSPTSAASMSR